MLGGTKTFIAFWCLPYQANIALYTGTIHEVLQS